MPQSLQDTLQERGLSITKPRVTVLKRLSDQSNPITMAELLRLCTGVDRVTVYRTVDAFEKKGIVKKVQIGWKYKIELGDGLHSHHHHMTCISCGLVIDFEESSEIMEEFRKLQENHGFRASSHNLELTGLCQNCQK